MFTKLLPGAAMCAAGLASMYLAYRCGQKWARRASKAKEMAMCLVPYQHEKVSQTDIPEPRDWQSVKLTSDDYERCYPSVPLEESLRMWNTQIAGLYEMAQLMEQPIHYKDVHFNAEDVFVEKQLFSVSITRGDWMLTIAITVNQTILQGIEFPKAADGIRRRVASIMTKVDDMCNNIGVEPNVTKSPALQIGESEFVTIIASIDHPAPGKYSLLNCQDKGLVTFD